MGEGVSRPLDIISFVKLVTIVILPCGLVMEMEDGRWRWRMDDGDGGWTMEMEDGRCGDGGWTMEMEDGRWRWRMDDGDGGWTMEMEDGRWTF